MIPRSNVTGRALAGWRFSSTLRSCALLIALLLPGLGRSLAFGQVDQSDILTVDVTTSGFSVVWETSEPSDPGIRVYADSAGTFDITDDFEVTAFPLWAGDPAAIDKLTKAASVSELRAAARALGLMKVRVDGAQPATTYYYRITSTLDLDTSEAPDGAPIAVTTTEENSFVSAAHQILFTVSTEDALGWLVTASAPGSLHPISAYVGDGAPRHQAFLNLSQLFTSATSNWDPLNSDLITLTIRRGNGQVESTDVDIEVSGEFSVGRIFSTDASGASPTFTSTTTPTPSPTPNDAGTPIPTVSPTVSPPATATPSASPGPGVPWSTFLGGAEFADAFGVAVAPGGDLVVTGASSDWGTPVQPFAGGGSDVFVARLAADGALLWNTFLGGTGAEEEGRVAVDGEGNIYVTGSSMASWGSPLRPYVGAADAFVARVSGDGTLVWMTFLGGSGVDRAGAIAIAANGDILVAGSSHASWGSPVASYADGTDAFAARLDPSGSLLWHTFLGGAASDVGNGIGEGAGGAIYVAGGSYGSWGSPLSAFTGTSSAFVARLDVNGNRIWHTFAGGTGNDWGTGLAIAPGGEVLASGYSTSSWGTPVVPYSDHYDAFVSRFASDGTLLWNSFLGGVGSDEGLAIGVDRDGNIYVTGASANEWGDPLNPHASPAWDSDAFVARLGADGSLVWSTFLGGPEWELGFGLAPNPDGVVYAVGASGATWGSPIRPFSGQFAAYVAALPADGGSPSPTPTATPSADTSGIAFLVCDPMPLLADLNGDGDTNDPGEFGNGVINNSDVVGIFRASLLDELRPPVGSARFMAMDPSSEDAPPACGGNGAIVNNDVVQCFRRSLLPGLANYERRFEGEDCVASVMASDEPELPLLMRRARHAAVEASAYQPRRPERAAASVVFGQPDRDGNELILPIELRRLGRLRVRHMQAAVQAGRTVLEFTAATQRPELTLREGGTLLLGWLAPLEPPLVRDAVLGSAVLARHVSEGRIRLLEVRVLNPSATDADGDEVPITGAQGWVWSGAGAGHGGLLRIRCDARRLALGAATRCWGEDRDGHRVEDTLWFAGHVGRERIELESSGVVLVTPEAQGRSVVYAMQAGERRLRRVFLLTE